MSEHLSRQNNTLKVFVVLLLSWSAAAQYGYGDNGQNTTGRVIAGIIAAIVVVMAILLVTSLVIRARRRRMAIEPLPTAPPMMASNGYSAFPRNRNQSYMGENLPVPVGYPAAPAYQPPPPPYHRKESFQGQTIPQPTTPTQPTPEYTPPPPAHVNDSHSNRFGWLTRTTGQ